MKYIGAFIVMVVLFTSNPSLQDHQSAVSAKVGQVLRSEVSSSGSETSNLEKIGIEFGVMLGSSLLDNMVKEVIKRKDYFFFSLTSFEYNGENRIIGIGVLGNVFISNDVEQELRRKGDLIKGGIGDLLNSDRQEDRAPDLETVDTPSNEYYVKASDSHPVYVYDAPDAESVSTEYYDSRVRLTAIGEENGFVNFRYNNSKNESASGWIAKEELEKSEY